MQHRQIATGQLSTTILAKNVMRLFYWLAGMRAGVYPGAAEFAQSWALERRFEPKLDAAARSAKYAGWQDAVRRTLSA